MEREHTRQLESKEYSRLLMKVLNENNDELGAKLSLFDDNLNLYLYNPDQQNYTKMELDMRTQIVTTFGEDVNGLDNYMNGKTSLLYVELDNEQKYREIEQIVEELKDKHQLTFSDFNEKPLVDLTSLFEKQEFQKQPSSYEAIQLLAAEREDTVNKLGKIDELIQKLSDYKENYIDNQDVMNLETIDYSFEQNDKVEILYDNWNEIKDVYQRKDDLLKTAINYETERFLKTGHQFFKNVNLDRDDLSIANKFSATDIQKINNQTLIPMVQGANISNVHDRVKNSMDNHLVADLTDYTMKRINSYNYSFDYEESKFKQYLGNIKDFNMSKLIQTVEKEFANNYGDNFAKGMITEVDRKDDEALFRKFEPILETKSFNLAELQNHRETHTKEDVNSFWEQQNLRLLTATLSSKENGLGIVRDIEERFITHKMMDDLVDRSFEISSREDPFANKMLHAIKDNIESAKDLISGIKNEMREDLGLIAQSNVPEDKKIQHNIATNNFIFLEHTNLKLDAINQYVSELAEEKSKTFEKEEIEHEL